MHIYSTLPWTRILKCFGLRSCAEWRRVLSRCFSFCPGCAARTGKSGDSFTSLTWLEVVMMWGGLMTQVTSSCKLVSVTDVASPMFCGHTHPGSHPGLSATARVVEQVVDRVRGAAPSRLPILMVFCLVAPFVTLAASTINSRIGLTPVGVRYSLRTRRVQKVADGYAQCKLCKIRRSSQCSSWVGVYVRQVLWSRQCSTLFGRLQVQFLDKVVVPVLCNDRFFGMTVST